MADIARPEISPSPSKIGTILSSIGKLTLDSTLADFLSAINGRKKVHYFVQQKVKGRPLPPLSSNHNKRTGDLQVIVHDVQEVVQKGQEEAVKLHERCAISLGGPAEPSEKMPWEAPKESNHTGTNRNRVFIRSRL